MLKVSLVYKGWLLGNLQLQYDTASQGVDYSF